MTAPTQQAPTGHPPLIAAAPASADALSSEACWLPSKKLPGHSSYRLGTTVPHRSMVGIPSLDPKPGRRSHPSSARPPARASTDTILQAHLHTWSRFSSTWLPPVSNLSPPPGDSQPGATFVTVAAIRSEQRFHFARRIRAFIHQHPSPCARFLHLSGHASDTPPRRRSFFARQTSLHSPRVSLSRPGPVAARALDTSSASTIISTVPEAAPELRGSRGAGCTPRDRVRGGEPC